MKSFAGRKEVTCANKYFPLFIGQSMTVCQAWKMLFFAQIVSTEKSDETLNYQYFQRTAIKNIRTVVHLNQIAKNEESLQRSHSIDEATELNQLKNVTKQNKREYFKSKKHLETRGIISNFENFL